MNTRDRQPVTRAINSEELPRLAGFAQRLIRLAARGAPPSLTERLEEEWLADLATRAGVLSRLRFAFGCCWATRVIAHEHCASGVAVASTPLGGKFLVDFLHDNSGGFSRRSMTLILVVGLHIAVFYGLMTGLSGNFKRLIPSSFVTRVLQEPHPQVLPPPPPPTFSHGKVEVVIPEFQFAREPDDGAEVVARQVTNPPESPPTPPTHVVNRVPGGPGSGFPNTDDFYPSAAKRMEEQGAATVRVCVDVNGRLTTDPVTVQTSGSARLDAGALQLAKAGSGHYRASTEDGRPIASCYPFRVRFQLRN